MVITRQIIDRLNHISIWYDFSIAIVGAVLLRARSLVCSSSGAFHCAHDATAPNISYSASADLKSRSLRKTHAKRQYYAACTEAWMDRKRRRRMQHLSHDVLSHSQENNAIPVVIWGSLPLWSVPAPLSKHTRATGSLGFHHTVSHENMSATDTVKPVITVDYGCSHCMDLLTRRCCVT